MIEGSFFVRAERERLGLRPPASTADVSATPPSSSDGRSNKAAQTAKVVVNEQGYEPANLTLRAVRTRTHHVRPHTDKTCGTEVVFPSLNIKRALPLNEPVVIEFTPAKPGDIAFACGMNMLRGTVVVR